jgi:hypothetical protein
MFWQTILLEVHPGLEVLFRRTNNCRLPKNILTAGTFSLKLLIALFVVHTMKEPYKKKYGGNNALLKLTILIFEK